jgi:hypothetical protein
MFIEPTIHPDSFLARLCRQEPLVNTAGKEPLRQIPFLRWDGSSGSKIATTATLVSVDNGNDAFKGALRRHLGSAIDLLVEHGQHPYQAFMSDSKREHAFRAPVEAAPEKDQLLEHSIEEDLDMLGIGVGLSETLETGA